MLAALRILCQFIMVSPMGFNITEWDRNADNAPAIRYVFLYIGIMSKNKEKPRYLRTIEEITLSIREKVRANIGKFCMDDHGLLVWKFGGTAVKADSHGNFMLLYSAWNNIPMFSDFRLRDEIIDCIRNQHLNDLTDFLDDMP